MRTPHHHARSRLLALLPALAAIGGCDWPAPETEGATCGEISIPQASITVDGATDDWAGVAPQLQRTVGVDPTRNGYSLTAAYLAADAEQIYVRIDAAAGASHCGNGFCENDLGEHGGTCPEDCGTSQTSELRIYFKTNGYRVGAIAISRFGGSSNPWSCQGNWQGNSSEASGGPLTCNLAVKDEVSVGLVIELAIKRDELGEVVNIYPVWGRCCENDQGPVIDDEIGCVWSRL